MQSKDTKIVSNLCSSTVTNCRMRLFVHKLFFLKHFPHLNDGVMRQWLSVGDQFQNIGVVVVVHKQEDPVRGDLLRVRCGAGSD